MQGTTPCISLTSDAAVPFADCLHEIPCTARPCCKNLTLKRRQTQHQPCYDPFTIACAFLSHQEGSDVTGDLDVADKQECWAIEKVSGCVMTPGVCSVA